MEQTIERLAHSHSQFYTIAVLEKNRCHPFMRAAVFSDGEGGQGERERECNTRGIMEKTR